jgi:outer membrane lipoprotein-sorting protein
MLTIFVLSFAGQLCADEAAEEKAAELLDKYVVATGGKEAFGKIKNRVTEMSFELPTVNVTMKVKVYSAKPNKSYVVMKSDATGTIEQGCDGKVVWEKSELTGCRIKTGADRSLILRESKLDRFVDWQEVYDKAELVGTEEVEGRPCYKIVMTPKASDETGKESVYIDKETSLIAKIASVMDLGAGAMPVAYIISDYKDVGGVKLSHKMKMLVTGQEQVFTIDSVKNNVDIPADRFALPEEVQELLKETDE